MAKVLITDCWTRKSLSAVRSLGREGICIDAVSHTRIAPAIYSKFVHKYFILPDPKEYPDQYYFAIMKLLQENNYDCMIPFEESSIEIFLNHRTEIEKFTKTPIPSNASYHIANDKWKVLQLAKQLNIHQPLSFCPLNIDEALSVVSSLKFPIIIKPKTSSGSRGIKKVSSLQSFKKIYEDTVQKYGFPIIQECIPIEGEGCGVGVLALNGRIVTDFSYKRLREFPVNGGPSTLRESTDDIELKKYASLLMEALEWTGVAMIEFKRDPITKVPKLMEINPRFWGSLDLAYVSGINFPYLLFKLSQNQDIEQQQYKTGILCRWLLPGDIAHFIANPSRFLLKPSFFNFFNKETYYDDFKKYDCKGNIAVIICTIAMVFDPKIWRLGVFRK
jgi:predicted ATP-grasp superfamily ATP-dependent carboligase